MIKRVRAPFETNINGHHVKIAGSDASIMIKQSAIQAITENVLVKKRTINSEQPEQAPPPKKKRRRNATVNSTMGANGYEALFQTQARDRRLDEARKKKEVSGLQRKIRNMEAALALMAARKKKI